MKNKLVISTFIGIVSLLYQKPVEAITLGFSPSSQTTNLGNKIDVDLIISDLGDGVVPSLGTFDLEIGFDAEIIGFDELEFGEQLNPVVSAFTFREESLITPDKVNLFEISGERAVDLIQLQPSDFTLATISFDALGIGTSELSLENVVLGDEEGNSLITDIESGSITVIGDIAKTVPEGSTIVALIGLGLLNVLGWKRGR